MPSLSVNKIKSIEKAGLYADGHNLYLRVKSKKSKSWVFRYMFNQRRHDMGLGSTEFISLSDARFIAIEQRRLLHENINPIDYRKQQEKELKNKILQKRREGVTFQSCAREYIQSNGIITRQSSQSTITWIGSIRGIMGATVSCLPNEVALSGGCRVEPLTQYNVDEFHSQSNYTENNTHFCQGLIDNENQPSQIAISITAYINCLPQ
tara:strand:+ start:479 stop:1102 length:624 start_codon:yes stop_codon:yes gene_type:complete